MNTTNLRSYFKKEVKDRINQDPLRDKSCVIKPARITPSRSVRNTVRVIWNTINLPEAGKYYHVYQIGEIDPNRLGISRVYSKWLRVDLLCIGLSNHIELYTDDGKDIWKSRSYFLRTRDDNLILAVEANESITPLANKQLYLRVYSNQYHKTLRSLNRTYGIHVQGKEIKTEQDRVTFLAALNSYKARTGSVLLYVNGEAADPNGSNIAAIGSYVEFTWDATIESIQDVDLDPTKTFLSELDDKQKYLIHYTDAQNTRIDYINDITFLLIRKRFSGFTGIHYPTNFKSSVRMLTHKDYSVPVSFIDGLIADHPTWESVEGLTLRLIIRNNGNNQSLTDVNPRISELYKLSDELIVQVMVGIDSLVSVWSAASLENSAYAKVMYTNYDDVDLELCVDALGHDGVGVLVGDSPLKITNPNGYVVLPISTQDKSTIYEYDSNGLLLGDYVHEKGVAHSKINTNCAMIEVIPGIGSYKDVNKFQVPNYTLKDGVDFKVYKCPIVNGEPNYQWMSCVKDVDYTINNGVLTYLLNQSAFRTAIRESDKFLNYKLILNYANGVYRFTVNSIEMLPDGNYRELHSSIIFGQLDIWMNNKHLIKDLDYSVDWPEICVINKSYQNPSDQNQVFQIRAFDFCTDEFDLLPQRDYGWIINNRLSMNSRYDVRDGKVLRISVDGSVKDNDTLIYQEDEIGIGLLSSRNGAPYQIIETNIPVGKYTDRDTTAFREECNQIDQEISDYLTLKLGLEPVPETEIENKHVLYSPFITNIVNDIKNLILKISVYQTTFTDEFIKNTCTPYEFLLKYDPIKNNHNKNYTRVVPHNHNDIILVTENEYNFIARAIDYYLNGELSLENSIEIGV